jgi:hypothetical protein
MTKEIVQRCIPCPTVKKDPTQPDVAVVDVEAVVQRGEPAWKKILTDPSPHPVMDSDVGTHAIRGHPIFLLLRARFLVRRCQSPETTLRYGVRRVCRQNSTGIGRRGVIARQIAIGIAWSSNGHVFATDMKVITI